MLMHKHAETLVSRPTVGGVRRLLPPLVIAVLIVSAWSIHDSYFNYLIKLAALNVAVVCGLNLLMGYAGQAYIAVAATFAIGAYASALGMMKLGLPFIVSWLGGSLVAGVFGVLSGVPAFRLAGAYLAMVSIAFNIVVEETLIHWADVTNGPIGLSGIPAPEIAGHTLDGRGAAALATAVAALSWLAVRALRRSSWGLAMVAIRESEIAAKSLGIDTVRLKAVVFFASACIIGLAGGLYGHSNSYISPDIATIFASIIFVLMLILGGMGTSFGPVVGAILLTVAPQLLSDFQRYHLLVLGGILLALIVLMPQGLVAGLTRLVGRQRRPLSGAADGLVATGAPQRPFRRRPGAAAAPLVVRDVRRSFGGIVALGGVDITVEPGLIRGLIGPNGSGKSTLVNVITGLYRADRGSIVLGTVDLTCLGMTRVARAGVVRTFQTPQLFGQLTVRENLLAAQFPRQASSLAAAVLDTPHNRREIGAGVEWAVELARMLDLGAQLDRPASELPQGERRKLEIGRALAAEPSVLILDEPAAGLSPEEGAALCQVLEALRASGLAILLIEHHMDVVMRVCDRITVLDQGLVIAEGTPAEIREDARVRLAYLGSIGTARRRGQRARRTA
jgi:ABC-type branched-subunit amino acid transport system ATPase component/ABC-type branched-subunit amino acid transport system permease subunit